MIPKKKSNTFKKDRIYGLSYFFYRNITILSETQLQQHVAMHYQQTQPAFAYLS